jgi:shikimate dehydrogenase
MTGPRACIIGHPVAHSRSPMIHTYWLNEMGLSGSYGREDVAPDAIAGFLADLPARGYIGGNVTVPHKEAALAAADSDAVARAIGAANTVWIESGRLRATNTDVHGFLANLDERAPGWDRSEGTAVVLGAGGAARAVLFGLLQRGFAEIILVNRSADRARLLADHFGARIKIAAQAGEALARASLLVNTTSLGMVGQPPLVIDLTPLPADAVVHDIVYVPLETPLLAAARARGLRAVDGLGMLLHQAVPGFEIWFGGRPLVSAQLRGIIEADVLAKTQKS